MKKTVVCVALLGLAVLAACSGDSPGAPPAPTVVPTVWTITSISADNGSPFVGNAIVVQAVVKRDGSDAPDNTGVEFSHDGDGVTSGFVNVGELAYLPANPASVNTVGGVAEIGFFATTARTYTIQARIHGEVQQVLITFRNREVDDSLEIYQPLTPNVGSYDGGETVVLDGKGIRSPVAVSFNVAGVNYPAQIVSVSEGKAATGSITILTPYISGEEVRSENREANVTVTVGINTGNEESVTLLNAFTFLTGIEPGGPPAIFVVNPNSGRSSGGETVTIFGRNLENTGSVAFTFRGQKLESQIVAISPDGLQVDVLTPRFSSTPIAANEFASITLTDLASQAVSLIDAFVVLADEPQPVLASFSPIAGPLDGGTLVTIFGSGFQVPVQVQFGNLTATDVNVFDDTSIADNDRITCLSPDYSQQGETVPVSVTITVTNMTTGKTASKGVFTYGDELYITGNSPSEGRVGDLIIIFGSGFEDPLQVVFDDNTPLDVVDVSGTQLLVKFPDDTPVSCTTRNGDFEVTMLESNLSTKGGDFDLLGNSPRVTGVSPIFVEGWENVVITGVNFAPDLIVNIAGVAIHQSLVDVIDESTIEVEDVPRPGTDFILEWDQTDCVAPGDVPGTRNTDTPVEVTVTNFPGGCSDTLDGALIYRPSDTSCVAASAVMSTVPAAGALITFDTTAASSCSSVKTITISNDGAANMTNVRADLEIQSETDVFKFDPSGSQSEVVGIIPPLASATVDIKFCPLTDDSGTDTADVRVSADGQADVVIKLTGDEQP